MQLRKPTLVYGAGNFEAAKAVRPYDTLPHPRKTVIFLDHGFPLPNQGEKGSKR